MLDRRPSRASHTSPQRLAQPGIFRPASPPNLCNKVLSALENCLPGLVLEKRFLYVCFGWAILSSGTLYIIETTYMTYNALNSMLSDQTSFHFHVPSLQQSPSLCSLFLLVYCFLSVGFPTPLSVPRQTDGSRAVQRLLLPAIVHIPAVYQPYQVPFAQECLYTIYFLAELKSLIVTKRFFSFAGTVWHCPPPISQQS